MLQQLLKYKTQLITAVIVIVVLIVVYLIYQKVNETTIKVVDDRGNPVSFSAAEQAEAKALAARLQADLKSGWLWGHNFWGNIGRDEAAYDVLMNLSDTMFSLVCQTYQSEYKSSLISDLREETSLGTVTRGLILERAKRLTIK